MKILELKTNYSVSVWVKVQSQKIPLQHKTSCEVFNPLASWRSSNSVGSTCSPSGLLVDLVQVHGEALGVQVTILITQHICN